MILTLYDRQHIKLRPLHQIKDLHIDSVLSTGDKTLSFLMPGSQLRDVYTEAYISTPHDDFVIKSITPSSNGWYQIQCCLNVEELESYMDSFESVEKTMKECLDYAFLGTGWHVGTCEIKKKRTIRRTNTTPWKIMQDARKTYRAEIKINSKDKVIDVYEHIGSDKGVYFAEQLNLKQLNKQVTSYDFYTQIKPIGANGLTIESVNDGNPILSNHAYSKKDKLYIWTDQRYTVTENLKADAQAKLDEMSTPLNAYSLQIIDLAKISDDYVDILSFGLGDTVTLMHESTNTFEKTRIVSLVEYPNEPNKNKCEVANSILKFEDIQQEMRDASDTINNVTTDNGTLDGSKVNSITTSQISDFDIQVQKVVDFTAIRAEIDDLRVKSATIQDLAAALARIGTLEATSVTTTTLSAEIAKLNQAIIGKADITDLTSINGKITILESSVATLDTIVNRVTTSDSIHSLVINASTAVIDNAFLKSIVSSNITVNDLLAGDISTTRFKVKSDSGNLLITDNTIQISDTNRVRVQVGKDASGDYNMYVWDKTGNLMFDATGITAKGIQRPIIVNDMVSDNANISGDKINITSVIQKINANTTLIESSHILYDGKSLDVAFGTMETSVSTVTTNVNTVTKTVADNKGKWDTASTNATNALNTANTVTKTVSDNKANWDKAPTALTNANNAQNTANNAQSIANSKAKVFSAQPVPPYQVGDLWVQGTSGVIMRCKTARASGSYTASDWEKADKYTDDTKANAVDTKVTTVTETVKSHSTQLTAQDGKIATLITDTTQVKKDITAVQGDVTTAKGNITTLQTNYSALDQTVKGLSSTVGEHTSSLSTVTTIANDAKTLANTANTNASTAKSDASTAKTNASTALSTANTAKSTADTAKTDATTAKTNASNAVATANTAKTTADSAKTKIEGLELGGINLLIVKNVTKYKYLNNSGAEVSQNDWFYSDYIPVKGLKNLVASGYSNLGISPSVCYYDKDKKFVKGINNNSQSLGRLMTIDSGIEYIRFSGMIVDLPTLKIEKGTKPTNYSPAPQDVDASITTVNTRITTEIKTVSDKYASLQQDVNGFKTTVSSTYSTKAEVNKVKSDAATDATNKANQAKTDAINSANANTTTLLKSYSTTSAMNSAITQKASEITTAVSNTYTTKADFNNMAIGGRNLVLHSEKLNGLCSVLGGATFTVSYVDDVDALSKKHIEFKCTADGTGFHTPVFSKTSSRIGKKYTWSFWAKCSVNKSGNVGSETGGQKAISLTTSWQYYTHTWTMLDSQYSSFTWYLNYKANEILYVRDFKIEEGTRATSWTPAPEDIDSSIATVDGKFKNYYTSVQTDAKITTKADEITSNVSKTYATQATVNTINGDVSALKSWKTSAELKITDTEIVNTVTKSTNWTTLNNKATDAQTKANNLVDLTTIKDTRSTNSTPEWYFANYAKKTVREFKTCTAIGITGEGTYGTLETAVAWNDAGGSGGYPVQLFYPNNSQNIYRRVGTGKTTWGAWSKVAGSHNIISSINQTAETIKISASKIDLVGKVTISMLDGDTQTKVNNGNSAMSSINTNKANWDKGKTAYDWTNTNGGNMTNLRNMVLKWTNNAVSTSTYIQGGWIATNTITSAQIATGTIVIGDLDSGVQSKINNSTQRIKYTIDLSSSTYDVNTYYPVTGSGIPTGGYHLFECAVQLDSGTKPSWSTHDRGYSCNLVSRMKASGWGTTNANGWIEDNSYGFCDKMPVFINQMTNSSTPVFFLRGGGKYFIYTDYSCTWTIRTTTYTVSSQSVAPSTAPSNFGGLANINEWCASANRTYIDGGKIYTGTITANHIRGNKLEGTEIVGGKISSNTTINVTTDLTVGDNVYLGTNGGNRKKIIFTPNSQIWRWNVNSGEYIKMYSNMRTTIASEHSSYGNARISTWVDSGVNQIDLEANKVMCTGIIYAGTSYGYFVAQNNQGLRIYDTSNTIREVLFTSTANQVILKNEIAGKELQFLRRKSNGSGDQGVRFLEVNTDYGGWCPWGNGTSYLGTSSYRWRTMYSINSCNASSDRKLKQNIMPIAVAKQLIMNLEPVQYTRIDGDSGRLHYGFIAQDVVTAAQKTNAGNLSLYQACTVDGGYYNPSLPDSQLEWGLTYEEFIAPTVAALQDTIKAVDTQGVVLNTMLSKMSKIDTLASEFDMKMYQMKNEHKIEMQNMKSEYDAKLNVLQNRIKQLESQM